MFVIGRARRDKCRVRRKYRIIQSIAMLLKGIDSITQQIVIVWNATAPHRTISTIPIFHICHSVNVNEASGIDSIEFCRISISFVLGEKKIETKINCDTKPGDRQLC